MSPAPVGEPGVPGQERRLASAGEEAQVLRLGLGGDGQPGVGGQLAHLRLGEIAEREAQPRQRRGSHRGEHVRLVLGRVGSRPEEPVVGDPRVVAGGERRRADAVGELEHRVEPHVPVAAHARVRRLAARVRGQERVDDARPELRAQVEREVRHAHPVRDRTGDPDRMRGAARRLGVVLRVGPQLERHGGGVIADQQRRDRGVHPAAHRHERAARVAPPRRACAPPRRARGAAHRPPGRRRGTCPATARRALRRSRARRPGPRRARARPRSSVTAAEPAAVIVPQPEASKPAAATRSP